MTDPARTIYEPPRQGRRGQLLDAVVILVLIFATLFVTTYLTSEDASGAAPAQVQSVNDLPVTPGERVQYQKMIDSGTADLPTIAADVAANQPRSDKYEIDVLALLGTAVLLALYLGFVYRASFREYREVIEEKFGPAPDGPDTRTGGDR
jgi:hypothetical protein